MAAMVFNVDMGEFAASLCGATLKVWRGTGLPVYEGSLDGAAEAFPEFVAQLVEAGYVRAT